MKRKLFLVGLLCALALPAWGTSFSVLLSGATSADGTPTQEVDASRNIRDIAIDELNIDVREMTTGLDVEYRLYGPGRAQWGSAKFTMAHDPAAPLHTWYEEASQGKGIRKNITVTLFKSDKSAGRSYTLMQCFPTQLNFDTSSTVQTETLTVSVESINFTEFADSNMGKGRVAVLSSAGVQVDSYDSWGGGAPHLIIDGIFNNTKFRTNSPGHKTVGEITLRGAMTNGRKALCEWINDTVNGKPWKRNLTITELLSVDGAVKDGKKFNYFDCFPTRYVFPRISIAGPPAEQLSETIVVRPIRFELK